MMTGSDWQIAGAAALLGTVAAVFVQWLLSRRGAHQGNLASALEDQRPAVVSEDMRSVIGALEMPALVLGDLDIIICHNARVRQLFPKIADGMALFQVSRNPGVLDAVKRIRDDGNEQSADVTDRTFNGRRLRVTVSPLRRAQPAEGNAVGLPQGLLLVQISDTSEQDRLAQLRSDFIANASHELRTPLASVMGFIETLQGPASEDSAARSRFLKIMQAQASRMARILDDLLSLSRIEMRAHVRPKDDVEVGVLARSAVQGLEPIAAAANIKLSLSLPNEACHVRGDRDELEQVFQNLIHNAIKYGNDGGKVDVTVTRALAINGKAGRVIASVADDGPGIAEQHLPRLTERFYRVDTATSRERGGTGLGLAIVKHILNRHRGELDIESQVGKGSTFTVILEATAAKTVG